MSTFLKTVYVINVKMLKEHVAGRTPPYGLGRPEREAAGVLLNLSDSAMDEGLVDGLCLLREGGPGEVLPPPTLVHEGFPGPVVATEAEVRFSSRKRGGSRCSGCGDFRCRCVASSGSCRVTRSRTGSLPPTRPHHGAMFDCSGPV